MDSNGYQVQLSERNSSAALAEAQVHELLAKVDEQKKLISKLEEDILKVKFIPCIICPDFHS